MIRTISLGNENIELLDLEEAAKELRVTTTTMRSYFKIGKIKAQKIGGKWWVTKENLKKYITGG